MENFESNIKKWVDIDNKYREVSERLKELRSQRSDVYEEINTFVEDQNLQSAIIQISNGRLKFQTTKVSQPLTLKFVKSCLEDIIPNEEQVSQIIQHIKDSREFKYNKDIKRFYNE